MSGRPKVTAGRVACLGIIIALAGNELSDKLARDAFEIAAIIAAAIGLMLQ